ncbi:retrotransposable element Tf2 [Tanacetum coccineum]|uniref:Retrotransposable element Tf2 n=1 Tax=Tanacetum coccineum TaxID=301880 RepID=A0ABQ5J4V7_9ASTR
MNGNGRTQNQNQFTRMDFPKFLGDDVKGWIFRCEQFFSIDEIPNNNQKVKLISMHLFDTALLWYRQFIRLNGKNVSWNVYKSGILQRFGTVHDDPISEIRNVKYQTNAKDYQDTFDTLSSRVNISEEHAVSFYLGGLPAEIEMGVRMFRPKTLADAYSLTNFQEANLEAVRKKSKSVMTYSRGRFGNGMGQGTHGDEEYYEVEVGGESMPVQEELAQISLNALNGSNTFQTMRVTGKVGKHEIHILVDCGSTHNFLDDSVAKKIGFPFKDTCPLVMTLQGETFKAGMMIVPLRGCKMVLEIQWLATLGDIKCNFSQLKMEFVYNRRRIVLRGAPKTTLQWMEGKNQERKVEGVPHAELLMLSVFPNTGIQLMDMSSELQVVPKELQKVVGTPPVNIKPYRHPPTQKDAIEATVKELLEAGVIKASNSPFASPIVMVKIKTILGECAVCLLRGSESESDSHI